LLKALFTLRQIETVGALQAFGFLEQEVALGNQIVVFLLEAVLAVLGLLKRFGPAFRIGSQLVDLIEERNLSRAADGDLGLPELFAVGEVRAGIRAAGRGHRDKGRLVVHQGQRDAGHRVVTAQDRDEGGVVEEAFCPELGTVKEPGAVWAAGEHRLLPLETKAADFEGQRLRQRPKSPVRASCHQTEANRSANRGQLEALEAARGIRGHLEAAEKTPRATAVA